MIKKIFTLSLAGALLFTACQKNTNAATEGKVEIGAKYASIATITFPTYSLDYIFTNDNFVGQTISPTVSLALGMANVTGAYTMFYTTQVLSNGLPDFSNASTATVTFTAGNASNIVLNNLNLGVLGNSPGTYKVYVRFRGNTSSLPTVNSIYTIDIYKRTEFTAPVAATYGITSTTTGPIFVNPNAASGVVTLNYSTLAAVTTAVGATKYDLVAQVVDQSTPAAANMARYSNNSITSNMSFQYDFTDLMMSYGPITVNAYFVKNGLSSAQDPTASRVTLAVQPITICLAWVAGLTNGTTTGTLTNSVAAAGVSFTVNYTGGTGGNFPIITVASTGVTGLTATLSAGSLNMGTGTLTFQVTGTPSAAGTATFAINFGGSTRNYTITVS